MGRSPCCAKEGLNRGAWTALEDKILTDYIKAHGEGRWRNLPKRAGLKRCGKSCRLRWLNYLRPDIKRGNISADEEELIIRLHKLLGNRWSLIAGRLPGRTDNEIKNYWNTNLGKKVQDHQKSNQPNEKKDHNVGSANYAAASSTPSKIGSFVIRTKASKCSRVVLDPELHKTQQSKCSRVFLDPQLHKAQQFINCQTHTGTETLELQHGCGLLLPLDNPVASGENYNNYNSKDFMMDFNLGEICLSEFFNSEFSDLLDNNYSNDKIDDLSPSQDQLPPMFSEEEMLQDWTDHQPFVASNVPFTSVLDSVGDWLG